MHDNNWHGAIFAAAGLERIELRPDKSVDLNWMLPAPAQGAIMIVCREEDEETKEKCFPLHHELTAICTKAERDFLRTLQGGCSTPIGALAELKDDKIVFAGNIVSVDGKEKREVETSVAIADKYSPFGVDAAKEILRNGGDPLIQTIRNAKG